MYKPGGDYLLESSCFVLADAEPKVEEKRLKAVKVVVNSNVFSFQIQMDQTKESFMKKFTKRIASASVSLK